MMPTQLVHDNNIHEIRAKIAYNGEVLITYINQSITLDQLCNEMREICRFSHDQAFTMKWVDEEGDPCTISTQLELDEAIRLYEVNRDSELTVHDIMRLRCDKVQLLCGKVRLLCGKVVADLSAIWERFKNKPSIKSDKLILKNLLYNMLDTIMFRIRAHLI
ncbi:hypothetical protein FQR65_LT01389 [Abscondita terminalis]|nr:hypothetical protein FQR65_LT01389 [Abscondita terminalis]